MAIDKDLNITPYFDDYSEDKKYHRVLFKPSVPVQARELTQMQTILQNQIERLGEFNFKEGSVIKGCQFNYDNKLKYIKLFDKRIDGQILNTAQFVKGQYAVNQSNVIFQISSASAGYEATTPDLNTIYGKYVQSSNSAGNAQFAEAETLTIFNDTSSINSATWNVAVTISTTADVAVNSTYGNAYSNADTFTTNSLFGSGLSGTLITNSSGTPTSVNVTANGSGYKITELVGNGIPIVVTTSTGDGNLKLSVNTLAAEYQVKAANSTFANALGNSYGFAVGDGVIYQKGTFVSVDEQNIVVQKYNNRPDQRSVAFDTIESTINSTSDSSLLDNASGFNNENAPGADRLKLTANLIVNATGTIESTNNALKLVSWENGHPVRVNQQAQLASLGKSIAQRTAETQGDYVVNPFTITSEAFNSNNAAISVSSGIAYVGGHRFELTNSSRKLVDKSKDTLTSNSHSLPFNYGNSLDLNNMLGNFDFDKSPTVYLLDTAYEGTKANTTHWRSGEVPVANGANVASANVLAASQEADGLGAADLGVVYGGTVIGTVKLNNLVQQSGKQGFANAEYKAFVSGVSMRPGKKFAQSKAVWVGTNTVGNAIADIVLTNGVAKLKDSASRAYIFDTSAKAVKTISGDYSYPFRARHQGDTSSSGVIAISNTDTDTTFIYGSTGTLTTTQEQDLVVIPANTVTGANVGTAATAADANPCPANTVIAGSVTATLAVGDMVRISGGDDAIGNTVFRTIDRIVNSTAFSVTPGTNTALIGGTSGIAVAKAFLKNVPVNMASPYANAVLSNSGKTLTIDIGSGTLSAAANLYVYCTERDTTATRKAKELQANVFVHINCANAAGGVTGPWDLGVTDIRSIKNVFHGYDGAGGITNTAMPKTGTTDYSNNFILDNGQKDGYYGQGKLILNPDTSLTINTSSRMTIELDAFTESSTGHGFYTVDSYPIDDTTSPAANTCTTEQIPIFRSPVNGRVIDLRNVVDARPVQNNVSNTAATVNTTANSTTVTVNPNNATTTGWKRTSALRFAHIDENFVGDVQYYLRRIDKLEITSGGELMINRGEPALRPTVPPTKNDNMQLGVITIPPYPSLDATTAKTANRPDLAIRMNNKQVQRLTQKQLSNLQTRVGKLEYYTSLNMLEKAASDLVIGSSANSSLDRFKNGILVDNFETLTIADLQDREFKAGHDKARKFCQPRFNPIPAKIKHTVLRGVRRTGDTITLDYKQRPLLKVGTGTTDRKIGGRDWQFTGQVRLYPDYDAHIDVNVNLIPAIEHEVDTAPIVAPPDLVCGTFPYQYTDNETIVDGQGGFSSVATPGADALAYLNSESFYTGNFLNWGMNLGPMNLNFGSGFAMSTSHEAKVGDYVTDIAMIGKVRSQRLYFHATGLRPNMKHYVYFDGTNVSTMIRSGSVANNASINSTLDAESSISLTGVQGASYVTTNGEGEIAGAYFMPSDTFNIGARKFALISEDNYANFSAATSRAATLWNSFNYTVPTIELQQPPNPKPVIIAPEIVITVPADDVQTEVEDTSDYEDPVDTSEPPTEEATSNTPYETVNTAANNISTPEVPVDPVVGGDPVVVPHDYGGGAGYYEEIYRFMLK